MNASRLGYDYKLGSQVSYNCHHGYITVGAETITCVMGKDGKPVWDKALPTCKGKGEPQRESCVSVFVTSGCASHFVVNDLALPPFKLFRHCSVSVLEPVL